MKEENKKEIKERPFVVVKELPEVKSRIGIDEDDKEIDLLTTEEAMAESLRILRRLDKAL